MLLKNGYNFLNIVQNFLEHTFYLVENVCVDKNLHQTAESQFREASTLIATIRCSVVYFSKYSYVIDVILLFLQCRCLLIFFCIFLQFSSHKKLCHWFSEQMHCLQTHKQGP